MNPSDKFISPRAAPTPPETPGFRRIGTAPQLFHKRSARSMSPGSGWAFSPRKLFSRKASSSSLAADAEAPSWEDERSIRSSEGSRSRDISPDSLRRFLSDDTLPTEELDALDWPSIAIPEDIFEENEDDDNFATSAVSETLQYTALSPPPTQRCFSPSVSHTQAAPAQPDRPAPAPPTRSPPEVPPLEVTAPVPQSRFSLSDTTFYSQNSPQSPDSHSLPSFYHSEDEDDDFFTTHDKEVITFPRLSSLADARTSFVRDLDAALSTYSLPHLPTPDTAGKLSVVTGSPALLARDGTDVPVGNTSLLTSPIPNSGLEELVNELGWMADVIRGKDA